MANKDVFISYKAEEFDDANWVKCTLENNGISCWMAPASIPGGSSYASEIPQAIRSCKVFVLLLSEKSQQSKWVPRELDQAINENKIVMPFMLENCALKDDFNFYLTNVQRYAAYESKAKAIEKMIQEIKSVLGATIDFQNQKVDAPDKPISPLKAKSKKKPVVSERIPKPKKPKSTAESGGKKKRGILIGACSAAVILIVIIAAIALSNAVNSSKILIAGKTFRQTDSYVSLADATLTEEDLALFDRFEKLTTISLTGCKLECSSIGKLGRPELHILSLVNCGLTDEALQSLDFSTMDGLTDLDVSENDLSDDSFLKELGDSLKKLNISGTALSDLSVVSSFENLSELQASGNGIETLSPLASCTALTTLVMDNNKISDLTPLADCVHLLKVSVNGNQLTTLAGLERCLDLADIEAGSNNITSLSGISNATVLKHVYLSDNQLTDISVLAKSAGTLQSLYVRNNQIERFDFPSGLPALVYLNIDHNRVTSLASLENSANLTGISARDNRITSMKGLENNSKLNYLDLSDNQMKVTGIENLQFSKDSMVVVNLSGNQIEEINLSAEKGYRYLDLHNTGLRNYGTLYTGTGYDLIFDYSDAIDFASLKNANYSHCYIIGCPLDQQVSVRDTLGTYSAQFVDANVCDEVMSNYVYEAIKGNSVYFK